MSETKIENQKKKEPKSFWGKFFSSLGPGLVTGAADDDPSGIFTYSQAGAQFGLGQLWAAVGLLPFVVAIQEACGRIGLVTGKGLSKIIKEHYSKQSLYGIVLLLLTANTINLGADLGAMAEVSRLILPLPYFSYAIFFFVIILLLEIFIPYHKYAKILKWLTLSLFAYIITGLVVSANWGEVLKATFLPHIELSFSFLVIFLGVVGTTISPYLFFWEASQEVEEKEDYVMSMHRREHVTKKRIINMRMDTIVGMVFSNLTTWFIIMTTAVVLHAKGIVDIQSAGQAAQALEPLVQSFPHAGKIAEVLFALGIIGTGFLAIPVFAATSSYAVSEIFGWHEGLANKFNQARGFYGIIILGTLVGLLMNLTGINPVKALIYTAIINGIIAVPIIFMVWKIGNNKRIMGHRTNGKASNFFIGITFLAMFVGSLITIYNLLKGW